MDTWKEFEANDLTHSAAHHLVAIHDVGLPYGGWARVSDIARQLNITRGSVSINLRALKKRGWVETDQHHLVKLTEPGLAVARSVMAKRMILKTFLSDVLGDPGRTGRDRQLQDRASHQPLDGPAAHAIRAVSDREPRRRAAKLIRTLPGLSGGVSKEPYL